MAKKQKNGYLSPRDSRRISKFNRKTVKQLERERQRGAKDPAFYTTQMEDPDNVVEFDRLRTWFFTDAGTVKAVDGVSFSVPKGATVGVVGESGCGKSVTSLSLMQLLPGSYGQPVDGEIRFHMGGGRALNLVKAPPSVMEKLRGDRISMIFQEPMTSLNPVFRIGRQIGEVLELHHPEMSRTEVTARVLELLELVGIPDGEAACRRYPHQLSGGMRQRIMIAMALACSPELIVADEPTTALDVTIQAQILDLLRDLKDRIGASILLITHDLGVVAEMADYVVVMYAGRVVERGTVDEIFHDPRHPYTVGLMKSRPKSGEKAGRLYNIPGAVPNPVELPDSCYFGDRCETPCEGEYPPEIWLSDTHMVSCSRLEREE